jgi:hypothetical protein
MNSVISNIPWILTLLLVLTFISGIVQNTQNTEKSWYVMMSIIVIVLSILTYVLYNSTNTALSYVILLLEPVLLFILALFQM